MSKSKSEKAVYLRWINLKKTNKYKKKGFWA